MSVGKVPEIPVGAAPSANSNREWQPPGTVTLSKKLSGKKSSSLPILTKRDGRDGNKSDRCPSWQKITQANGLTSTGDL